MTLPHEALRTILPHAGWGNRHAAEVLFTAGGDPVLPTPFRIGAAAAAAVAATGLAAAELWEIRTGRRQQVTVDVRQATASLRSGRYLKLAGARISAAQNRIMGVYATRDGRWSYLHCNFPNHRAAALGVLGVPEDRDRVARAVATWNAADLEEAIIARGCGRYGSQPCGVGKASTSRRDQPPCRSWKSSASATATPSHCQSAIDLSQTSACSILSASLLDRPVRGRLPSMVPTS
jgi:hypothetical protein